MTSRNLKITVEYDGARFSGWQVQPDRRTVQGEIERALGVLLGHPARVHVAGRTDAGVHALAQVCSVRTERDLTTDRIVRGLNGILAADVAVVSVDDVDDDFEPRFMSRGKHYRYRILNRVGRTALYRNRCWHLWSPLDLDAMDAALAHLRGQHDFSAFRAADCPNREPVKDLRVARLERNEPFLEMHFEASGFLKQMVRIIVGTVVEVGQGKRSADDIPDVIASGDRRLAGRTAPGGGLTMMKVLF